MNLWKIKPLGDNASNLEKLTYNCEHLISGLSSAGNIGRDEQHALELKLKNARWNEIAMAALQVTIVVLNMLSEDWKIDPDMTQELLKTDIPVLIASLKDKFAWTLNSVFMPSMWEQAMRILTWEDPGELITVKV